MTERDTPQPDEPRGDTRRVIYVGVGSNVDRERQIDKGLALLVEAFGDIRQSAIYESPAVGFDGEPFFNLVVELSTNQSLQQVSETLHQIERQCGRQRGEKRFAPRSLDLDLLTWGDDVLDADGVKLPRDEILHYAFVLRPLAELAPDTVHAGLGETFSAIWQRLADTIDPALRRVSAAPSSNAE